MKKLFSALCATLLSVAVFVGCAECSTRALQFSVIADSVYDPNTGEALSGGKVYFYEAGSGTSTPKNVWTEKAKTNAYTSYTLDSDGAAYLYGEGEYHIVIKTSDELTTVYDWDYFRIEHPNFYQHTVSSDYTQTSDDDMIYVDTTSGNKSITLLAAADWIKPLTVMNTGVNNVTITPDGSELIDGVSSLTISTINTAYDLTSNGTGIVSKGAIPSMQYLTGEGVNSTYSATIDYAVGDFATGTDFHKYRALIANGPSSSVVDPVGDATSTWTSALGTVVMQVFTADGTYTKSDGLVSAIVEVVGGGGGGGGVDGQGAGTFAAGGGGGAGGYTKEYLLASEIGATETVTVGEGGAGGAAGDNDGTAGETSSFGSLCQATGGVDGDGLLASSIAGIYPGGGTGGVGSGGDINTEGEDGGLIISMSVTAVVGGKGGNSFYGAGASPTDDDAAGGDAISYGGGGAGAAVETVATDYAGGDGADGIVIIYEYF